MRRTEPRGQFDWRATLQANALSCKPHPGRRWVELPGAFETIRSGFFALDSLIMYIEGFQCKSHHHFSLKARWLLLIADCSGVLTELGLCRRLHTAAQPFRSQAGPRIMLARHEHRLAPLGIVRGLAGGNHSDLDPRRQAMRIQVLGVDGIVLFARSATRIEPLNRCFSGFRGGSSTTQKYDFAASFR